MSCLPTYKGKRYNSLKELYNANGVNIQQAQQQYSQYLNTTNSPTIQGFKDFISGPGEKSNVGDNNAIVDRVGKEQINEDKNRCNNAPL